jgi:ABC-type multidrug transport system fused ATPase/permease subunit
MLQCIALPLLSVETMPISLTQYRQLLATYLQPQRRQMIWLSVTLLGSIALQVINPQIIGYFIDTATSGGTQQQLVGAATAFIAIALLTQVLSMMATYLGETVAWSATNALRLDLARHCLQLDLAFHKAHTPGELLERIDGDVNALSRFFSQLVIHILGNILLLGGILVILWFENLLAGVSLTLFALSALSVLLSLHRFAILPWARYRQMSAELFGFLGEVIAGREDLRANGAVGYVMDRFYRILRRWLPLYQKARFTSTVLWASSVGLFTVGNAIALAVCAHLWNQGRISIGTAYLIFHYTNLLNEPIERIREELEALQQAAASIHRIQALLQTPTPSPTLGARSLLPGALEVSVDHVWFRYHSEQNSSLWTLQDLSFHLPAGQILGLMGHTGSGKSTIAALLLQLYRHQRGDIRLGNLAVSDLSLAELRQRVGLVTQDVQLFQASIRDNLTFFNPQIPDADIMAALEHLRLIDWLRSLPAGLDTLLGASGEGLSAGQAQLLAFARIFLKNPGLVILDEASSRLDPETEQWTEQATERLLQDRTGIIIAHRLPSLQRANQVLILQEGRMLAYGDRQSLLELRPGLSSQNSVTLHSLLG